MDINLEFEEVVKTFEQMFPMQYTIVIQKLQIDHLQQMVEGQAAQQKDPSLNGSSN